MSQAEAGVPADAYVPGHGFGHLLRQHRTAAALTQEELAARSGLSVDAISCLERGARRAPHPYTVEALADALGVTTAEREAMTAAARTARAARGRRGPTPGRVPPATRGPQEGTAWYVPYRRNPFFTGRERSLAHLHAALRAAAREPAPRPLALSGMGGIGKTQTALEYVHRHRREHRAVLWLRADIRELLLGDIAAAARLLDLPQHRAREQERVVAGLRRWLESEPGWLLVLDNVEDLSLLAEVLPTSGRGQVIITTRRQAMGATADRAPLEALEPAEAVRLLLRRAGLLAEDGAVDSLDGPTLAAAVELCELLAGLPLAIDQAGAYMEETGCGPRSYLAAYRAREASLLARRGEAVTEHPASVDTTLTLASASAERADPAAGDLLRLFAFLHPDAIPEELVARGARWLGPALGPVAGDPRRLDEAIGVLLRHSLARRDPAAQTLSLHRLLQVVVRGHMDDAAQRTWAERAVLATGEVFPSRAVPDWNACQRCLPQALTGAALVGRWGLRSAESARLLHDAGASLTDRAQYARAGPLLQQALEIREGLHGPWHLEVAATLGQQGDLHFYTRAYDLADAAWRRALAIHEKLLGPRHPATAQGLSDLALLSYIHGSYTEAERLNLRSLAISEEVGDPAGEVLAETLNNLSVLYLTLARYGEAEPLVRRALALHESARGAAHPSTIQSRSNLGRLCQRMGRGAEAGAHLDASLAAARRSLGADHPRVAKIMGFLVELALDQGRLGDARALLEEALAIQERCHGPDHLEVAYLLKLQAVTAAALGELAEAEALGRRALAIFEARLGIAHLDHAICARTLASVLRERGQHDGAAALLERAASTVERAVGAEHPESAEVVRERAMLTAALGTAHP